MSLSASPSLFRNFGRNFAVIAMAFLYTALTFGTALTPSAAEARGKPVYYTAELAAPAEELHTVVNGVIWRCEGTSCMAAKTNSRAVITCARLSREMGPVTSFTAKGKALTADKLAKCND